MINNHPPIVSLALLILASSASAATIGFTTFEADGTDPRYKYGYTYQETGSSPFTNDLAAGLGVGGSAANRVVANFTAASGGYSGLGIGANIGAFGGDLQNAFTTPISLSDLSYSIFLAQSGALGATVTGNFEIKFEAPDGTIGATDGNTDVLLVLQRPGNAVSSTLAQFSGPLTAWNITGGSVAQLNANFTALNNINFNVGFDGGFNEFGNDAGNTVLMDNARIDQVPEPATLAVMALGSVALLARRRRVR